MQVQEYNVQVTQRLQNQIIWPTAKVVVCQSTETSACKSSNEVTGPTSSPSLPPSPSLSPSSSHSTTSSSAEEPSESPLLLPLFSFTLAIVAGILTL